MRPALHAITAVAAATVTTSILERLVPAIAAGLVAAAHVLDPKAARSEMERRS